MREEAKRASERRKSRAPCLDEPRAEATLFRLRARLVQAGVKRDARGGQKRERAGNALPSAGEGGRRRLSAMREEDNT